MVFRLRKSQGLFSQAKWLFKTSEVLASSVFILHLFKVVSLA